MRRRKHHTTLRDARGCLACGICCEMYGAELAASEADLARWRAEGRDDLLSMVGEGLSLWFDPGRGVWAEACPHLARSSDETALCSIHHTKPQMCREYPTPVHGDRCIRGRDFR